MIFGRKNNIKRKRIFISIIATKNSKEKKILWKNFNVIFVLGVKLICTSLEVLELHQPNIAKLILPLIHNNENCHLPKSSHYYCYYLPKKTLEVVHFFLFEQK